MIVRIVESICNYPHSTTYLPRSRINYRLPESWDDFESAVCQIGNPMVSLWMRLSQTAS